MKRPHLSGQPLGHLRDPPLAGGYRAFYLPLKAEFFVPLGDDIEELFTKQTRFAVGLGYVFDKSCTLELRYAQLRMRDTIGADLQTTNHFIELRVKSSFRIVDLLKGR